MLDIAVAYNRYRFLGNEFLTWIWFTIETDMDTIAQCDPEFSGLDVGNRMVLENRLANGIETLTIKGDAAGLEEAVLSLKKGALITEVQLVYKSGSLEWIFTIKGESLTLSGFKLPETAPAVGEEDLDGAVLEKIFLFEKAFSFIDALYIVFINKRLSDNWSKHILPSLRKWIETASAVPDNHHVPGY